LRKCSSSPRTSNSLRAGCCSRSWRRPAPRLTRRSYSSKPSARSPVLSP
jgi:hypothetical protein